MAKKMPLIIPTLAILTSMLLASNVGAATLADPVGPWSFDDVLMARNEVLAEVEAICPKNQYTRIDCADNIKYNKGGGYFRIVQAYQNEQFFPVSIDLTTDTLEYYFSSENLDNNFYMRNPIRGDYAVSMIIVQPKQGFDVWWTEDFWADFDDPRWQVIYSGAVAENGTSLLAVDQKDTLQINHPSFSSEYKNQLVGFVEYASGGKSALNYKFSDCVDGGEYGAWYGDDDPTIYFKDSSYNDDHGDGYDQGYNDEELDDYNEQPIDYQAGYDEGYNDGYRDGYEAGRDDSEDSGYDAGYGDGYNDGANDSFDDGFNVGYDQGYLEGRDEAFIDGYAEGRNEGQNIGYQQGYSDGYSVGRDDGQDSGYQEGYNAGYSEGLAAGHNATQSQDGEENNEGGDTLSDGTSSVTDENVDTKTSTSESLLNITDDHLKLNNATSISFAANNSMIKKPNTGALTTETSSASEFPWWLGAIFVLGFVTLVWLFWPSHKKSKNSQK